MAGAYNTREQEAKENCHHTRFYSWNPQEWSVIILQVTCYTSPLIQLNPKTSHFQGEHHQSRHVYSCLHYYHNSSMLVLAIISRH